MNYQVVSVILNLIMTNYLKYTFYFQNNSLTLFINVSCLQTFPTASITTASSLSTTSTTSLSLHQMTLPPPYPHPQDLNSYFYSSHQYYQQMLDSSAAAAYNSTYNSYQAAAAATAYNQNCPVSAYSAHQYFFGPR